MNEKEFKFEGPRIFALPSNIKYAFESFCHRCDHSEPSLRNMWGKNGNGYYELYCEHAFACKEMFKRYNDESKRHNE